MLVARTILGDLSESRYAGRTLERILVTSTDAAKRRLRTRTVEGTEVALDMPRGAYLRDGAVIADDGERLVVVERAPEPVIVVRLRKPDPASRLRAAALVGHAFGNQHVPIEVIGEEIRIPITTSRELVEQTLTSLGLSDVEFAYSAVPLARDRPLNAHGQC